MRMSKKIEVWRQNGHAGYTEADTTDQDGKKEEKEDSNTSGESDNSTKEMGWWPECLFLPVEISNQQTDIQTNQQLRRPVLLENTNMNCMPVHGEGGSNEFSGNNELPRIWGGNPASMPSQEASPDDSYTRDMPPHIRELLKRDPFL